MRAFTAVIIFCLAGLTAAVPVAAQEGHPLKGSWIGTWGPAKTHSSDLLLVLNWDGKQVTGQVNPGTDNITIKNATLTPEGWAVHIEFDGKDSAGAALAYTLDGKIDNLAMHNRTITGTWKNQRESGTFKVQRQ